MKPIFLLAVGFAVLSRNAEAQTPALPAALTVYNQNFAVVRETVPLTLKQGANHVTFDRATLHVEPDSVVLRDPTGKVALRILEQSYRADTASPGLMLSLYEGKEVDFLVRDQDGKEHRVRGKVIRSGYTPNLDAAQRYGNAFYQRQMLVSGGSPVGGTPIVEVDGQLRFSLPGEPVFPALADDAILRPTLTWQISSDRASRVDAELGYITGGLSWQAAYNLVSPEKGDSIDLVGWVTIDNQSGRTFEAARVKLMAGDVSKLPPPGGQAEMAQGVMRMASMSAEQEVTEKAFDEFHLYSLPRAVTLRNRETKQVEFLRAPAVKATTVYVYNGAAVGGNRYRGWNEDTIRNDRDYGTRSNPKIWVYREFKNTRENGLGIPLPQGRTRFYRQDSADGRIEFTGENAIEHTPEGETVRIYTGDAFDLVGERKRTDYVLSSRNDQIDEAFEIKLRNRKKEPVEIRVVERLYRGPNWTLVQSSDPQVKTDDRTIEFRLTLRPDEERVLTYRVRYDWK